MKPPNLNDRGFLFNRLEHWLAQIKILNVKQNRSIGWHHWRITTGNQVMHLQ
jgi:hypothetical protein